MQTNSFTPTNQLKIKIHTRHYYLGQAAFYMRRGNDKEVHDNMQVVERMQLDIENLERAADFKPILHRMW